MMPDKTNINLIDRYMDNRIQANEKNYVTWIKIGICIILYISAMRIQATGKTMENINGIIAQIQVMISVYLVVAVVKKGYVIAVVLNGIGSFMVAMEVVQNRNMYAIPGVIVPLCTIAIITTISVFGRRLNHEVTEVLCQREEIVAINEELSATEEELSHQNKQLMEYNAVMKANEEKLNYLAYFDALTELPNRKMIINRLELLIKFSIRNQMRFAVVFIDLDNFKRINDSMGHHIGDSLLQAVVLRLKELIHPEDMLGRLGGDEFALIIQRSLKDEEVLDYLEGVRTALLGSFMIDRIEHSISASFGISIYPQDGDNSTELLKCADTAMYKAKDCGKNAVQFFCREMKEEILKKIELENRLLSSIQNKEIFLMFQPQYTSDTKQLRGFEALVRWHSPELGPVSPAKLIPVAEETGFIIPLGEWILETACKTFKQIQNNYASNVLISVNISAVQMMEPSFIRMVKSVLERTGFNAKNLEFEITESVFISSMEYVVKVLKELKKTGIRIALDDFGTGYSSLNYIQLLPIDTLKIDKSFIDNIGKKNAKRQIVGSIISLVHQMNILVVAEGVENEIQLNYLRNQGCDCIQGFLWGKPLNEENLNKLLQTSIHEKVMTQPSLSATRL